MKLESESVAAPGFKGAAFASLENSVESPEYPASEAPSNPYCEIPGNGEALNPPGIIPLIWFRLNVVFMADTSQCCS
jgi:hypothetical protein